MDQLLLNVDSASSVPLQSRLKNEKAYEAQNWQECFHVTCYYDTHLQVKGQDHKSNQWKKWQLRHMQTSNFAGW